MVVFLIAVLIAGTFAATYENMRDIYSAAWKCVKKRVDSLKESEMSDRGEVFESIRSLMWITMGMGTDKAVWLFFAVSAVFGGAALCTIGVRLSLMLRICAVLLAAFLPYLMLRIRLEKIRVSSSYEGETLLSELTDNYKIYYYNMREAVEKTAESIQDAPNSRRILTDLARGLERAGSEKAVARLLQEFGLSIGTSWSNTLNKLMYFAIIKGIRVEEALEDLETTIIKARETEEYSRRQMNEPKLIIRYLIPMCYLVMVAGGIRFFGLDASEFFQYQFQTEAGATWFTIFSMIYIISYMANLYFSRNKLDL